MIPITISLSNAPTVKQWEDNANRSVFQVISGVIDVTTQLLKKGLVPQHQLSNLHLPGSQETSGIAAICTTTINSKPAKSACGRTRLRPPSNCKLTMGGKEKRTVRSIKVLE